MYRRKIGLLIALLLVFSCPYFAYATWDVWVIGESAKVKPDGSLANDEYMVDNPNYQDSNYIWNRTSKKITLKAARNEYIAFQVIVYANGEDLSNIDLTFSNLTKDGDTISNSNIEYFKETYISIPQASYVSNSKGAGEYPDPLVPSTATIADGAPYALNNGRSLPIWVDIYVPNGTNAGTYTGAVTVSANGKTSNIIDLELTVWNFTVPAKMNLNFCWHLYQNDIARMHSLSGDWTWNPTIIWDIESQYFIMAHEHRCQISPRNARGYIDFDNQGYLTANDWTAFDASFGQALDGTLYDDGIGEAVWEVQGFAGDPVIRDNPLVQQKVISELSAITGHFEAKGWMKDKILFTYYWDEPSISEYPEVEFVSKLQNIGSSGKIYYFVTEQPLPLDPAQEQYTVQTEKDYGPSLFRRSNASEGETDPYYPNWTGEKDIKIDIYCPNGKHYFPSDPNLTETADGVNSSGALVWAYQGSEPWMGHHILDADGLSFRTWGWAAWKYKVKGLFYWCVNQWSGPTAGYTDLGGVYTDANTYNLAPEIVFYSDGLLFYPGNVKGVLNDGPVASHRMKQIRRGMTDYEYFFILSNLPEVGGVTGDEFIANEMNSTINFQRAFTFYVPAISLTADAAAGATTITVSSTQNIIAHAEGWNTLKIINSSTGDKEIIYVTSFASGNVCNLGTPLEHSYSSGDVVAPLYAPYSWVYEGTLFPTGGRGEWDRNIDDWDQARENIALEIITRLAGADNDRVAPAQVNDLDGSADSGPGGSVDLTWTAPGDDGATGTATSYEIRYDTTDPVGASWGYAAQVSSPPTPQVFGSAEVLTISGLTPSTQYFFRLYTYDEAGNRSPLSNVAPRLADTTAPFTSGHSPANGATDIDIAINIVVHVKDADMGVDQSTIVMTVESVTVTPAITGTAADYTLTYTHTSDFSFGQVVNVTVDASDQATPPNVMTTDAYSFTCQQDTPVVRNQNPASSTTGVALDANIYFEIDGVTPVDSSTLNVTLEGGAAITAGVIQSGYSGSVTSDGSGGYDVTIDPAADFTNSQVVDIVINAANTDGTPMTQVSYSFTTVVAASTSSGGSGGSNNTVTQFSLCPVGMLLAAHPQELATYAAFKQKHLEPYAWGQKFINFYYHDFAPKASAFLEEHKGSQDFFRLVALSFSKLIAYLV